MSKKRLFTLTIFALFISMMMTSCEIAEEPVIIWTNPADIMQGTVLGTKQLNATTDVEGLFDYTPKIGTKLNLGANQELKVDFTPTDKAKYKSVSKTVKINVIKGSTSGTMTDQDGNTYKTVTIGSQIWTTENLKVIHYRNGDSIIYAPGKHEWTSTTSGAYCYYDNDTANKNIYGAIYNWYAVSDSRKIAPAGWHVPSEEEIITLIDYLGGSGVAGGKMKEAGTAHWIEPNVDATNESGFTALPSGYRFQCNSEYFYSGKTFMFWSSTPFNETDAFYRYIENAYSAIITCGSSTYTNGQSVRLIKD